MNTILSIENNTWMDILDQNKEVLSSLNTYDTELKDELLSNHKNTNTQVQREIVGSVRSEIKDNIKEAEKRILFEFRAYSNEDIINAKLTERETEVLRLRMIHNRCIIVSEILNVDPQSVYKSYLSGIKKIKRYRGYKAAGEDSLNRLSSQQLSIYRLIKDGFKNKQIADQLSLTPAVVKTQKSRIKKLGLL